MNEVATVQEAASTLKDKIAEKIRAQFVELIPDDTWSQMVEAEIKWFTTGKEHYHNSRQYVSPLQDDIRKALHVLAKDAIEKALSDAKWLGQYGPNGEALASEAVTKLVTENATTIVAQVFGSAVQGAVQNMRNSNAY